MTTLLRFIARLLVAACLPLALPAAEPPTIEHLLAPPAFSIPKLSPDGKRLVMLCQQDGAEYLAILDLTTMQPKPLGFFKDSHLRNCWWSGDHRILLLVQNENYNWQYRSIDPDTGKVKELSEAFSRNFSGNYYVVQALPDDPENILVENANASYSWTLPHTLSKLNLNSGKVARAVVAPGNIIQWVVNRRGEVAAALGSTERQAYLATKKPEGWQQVPLGPDQDLKLDILSIHADQRRLLVKDTSGPGTTKLVALDPATLATELLFQSPEVDPGDAIQWGDNDPAPYAIRYETDRPRLHYIDSAAQALMATIDRSLPDTFNEIISVSTDHAKMIVLAENERLDGMYYLLDRTAGRLVPLGSMRPDVPPAQLLTSRAFQFKARDGLVLHGRITLPAASGRNPPLLLYLWGPIRSASSQNEFNSWIQLLASRGYAVATIDYRGVRGYGREFEKAGDRQFGTGMPSDLEDGAKWLVEQNWVDGQQIGLIGRETAGLIAFQALLHSPLFKVWVNINTPMLPYSLDKQELICNERDENLIVTKMGGASAVHDYLATIEPRAQLPQVKVPSFHYYYRNPDNTLDNDGEIAESFFKKSPLPSLFLRGKPHANYLRFLTTDYSRRYEAEHIVMFRQLLPFLQQHLPVRGGPGLGAK